MRVWDGIGGILKSYLRRVNVRYLVWEEHKNDKDNAFENPVLCDGGRILTATHVHQQLERHFGTQEWRTRAEEKCRAISCFVLHFVVSKASGGNTFPVIERPPPLKDVTFERIEAITKSYQYFMIMDGELLVRRHSCWCLRCTQCALVGPVGTTEDYKVVGCARGVDDSVLYEYSNKNCRIKRGVGVGGPDEVARKHGHQVAAALDTRGGRNGRGGPNGDVGQLVLVEAFDDNGSGDVVWLGRTVAVQRFGGKCCQKQTRRTTMHGDESQSTVYSEGDYAIAVEWFERSADIGGLTFEPGDGVVCFVNSTELRSIVGGSGVTVLGGGKVRLSRAEEFFAQEWCR